MLNNILILDTETTALSPDKGKVIELAAILFNVPHKTILQQFSTLIPVEENPEERVNRISADASRVPMPWEVCLSAIISSSQHADAIVAHNADFDRQWMDSLGAQQIKEKQWICSCHDFSWPSMAGAKSLTHIALSLDVPVVSAHRALTDCLLLAACFSKLRDLNDRLEKAMVGKTLYKAIVSFDDRHLAKEAGFQWNTLVAGAWACKLTEEEVACLSFPIQKIE